MKIHCYLRHIAIATRTLALVSLKEPGGVSASPGFFMRDWPRDLFAADLISFSNLGQCVRV